MTVLCPGSISEKPAGNKIRQKTDIIPEVNITSRKASANGAGGFLDGGPQWGVLSGRVP